MVVKTVEMLVFIMNKKLFDIGIAIARRLYLKTSQSKQHASTRVHLFSRTKKNRTFKMLPITYFSVLFPIAKKIHSALKIKSQ